MYAKKGCFWLDCIAVGLMIVLNFLSYSSYQSYSFLILHANVSTFVMLSIFFINHIDFWKAIKNKDMEMILAIVVAVITLVNMMISKSGPGVLFDIANMVLILYMANKIQLKRGFVYALSGMAVCVLLIWIGKEEGGYNTNTAGYISLSMTYLLCGGLTLYFQSKNTVWIGKVLTIALILFFALPSVLKFSCRGALIGLVAFVIMNYFIPKKIWKIRRLYSIYVKLLIGAGVIFPILYIWLSKLAKSASLTFMNKNIFSGRDIVWEQFLEAFAKEPLTGIGNDFISKVPDLLYAEVHNGFLHFLIVYGIIIFVILVYLINKKFMIMYNDNVSIFDIQILSTLFSMLIISSLENYFAVSFFNHLFFIMLVMLNNRNDDIPTMVLQKKD